jgi:aspartate racemase
MHTHSFEDYLTCLRHDDWNGVSQLMMESGNKLAGAGADFLICPDNTIHQAFPMVASQSTLPWLHIAEVVADEAVRCGFTCLGILGTRWLVEGNVYAEKLGERSLQFMRPSPAECVEVDRIIFEELVYGLFTERSAEYVSGVIVRLKRNGCDAVVLGCTELPLIITAANAAIPALDSTRLLARAALERAILGRSQLSKGTHP